MRTLIRQLRARVTDKIVAGTSFCEACSQVCTAACRRQERLDNYHRAAHRNGLVHY